MTQHVITFQCGHKLTVPMTEELASTLSQDPTFFETDLCADCSNDMERQLREEADLHLPDINDEFDALELAPVREENLRLFDAMMAFEPEQSMAMNFQDLSFDDCYPSETCMTEVPDGHYSAHCDGCGCEFRSNGDPCSAVLALCKKCACGEAHDPLCACDKCHDLPVSDIGKELL